MYLQKSKGGPKPPFRPYVVDKKPFGNGRAKPPIKPYVPVEKQPLDKEKDSQPSRDLYTAERELLDLLQRKSADD